MAPYVGILRACGLKKETTVGTLATPPTIYLPFIPPDGFSPAITLLESMGIRALPDKIIKVTQGPAEIKGAKLKIEVEPENIGEVLMATFGTDTKTGPTNTTVYTHTFTRLAASQLPTYSFWFDRGPKFHQFTGCMMNKLDLDIKKGFIEADMDWTALGYDDSGSSKSPTYSTVKPFVFNQAAVLVDGGSVLGYEAIKISVDNMVKADHALSASIYPAKIYSEGMKVTLSATLFFEDTTQYAKFLAGTAASFVITLTHNQNVTGSSAATPYSMVITLPVVNYSAAPLVTPTGVLKVTFSGTAVYDVSTTKTISIALANSISATY